MIFADYWNYYASSYLWSDGSSDYFVYAYTSGTYCVTVTDANGCTGVTCIDITVNPNPTCSITPLGNTMFCQGGSVDLDAGSWAAYSWSTGESTEIITVTASGSYCVTITDWNGCTCVSCIIVYAIPSPSCYIYPLGSTSFCLGGSVSLDAGQWAAYLWSDGSNGEFFTATVSGTYCVTVTDWTGCTCVSCIDVNVYPNLQPIIQSDYATTFCDGGYDVIYADFWNYYASSYLWSDGSSDYFVYAYTSGTYCVTVTDYNGCTGIACIDITVNPNPQPAITLTSPPTFCNGGSVSLDAGAWSSYYWNTGQLTESIDIYNGGTYCLTITDNNGCTGSTCFDVIANPVPTPVISANGPTIFCEGGSVTLDAGLGYDTYLWSDGSNGQSISVDATGTYCVTVSLTDGCTGVACVDVIVNANPHPTITADGPLSFCEGVAVNFDAGTYASYLWSTSDLTEVIHITSTDVYYVTVTDANGCTGVDNLAATALITPTPIIYTDGPTTFCSGNSVNLTVGASFPSYNWNIGATIQSINIGWSGLFVVTVTSANGCTGETSITVVVNQNPSPVITPFGPTTFCGSGSTILGVSGNYASYVWSNGSTNSGVSVTVNATTTYCVTVTDVNGCIGTACQTLIVNPVINAVITPNGPTTLCSGGNVVLDAGAGYASYHWSNGSSNQSITANATGTYNVTVTSAFGCTGVASITVTVIPFVAPSITASGPTSFCSGGSVTLSTGVYQTYLWSNGATTSSISVSTGGTYSVTVSNGPTCVGSAQRTVTVLVSPVPNILPSGPTSFCAGGSVNLTVGASFSAYNWSNGATTQSITATLTGTYTVTVTNVNGCTGSSSITVSAAANVNPTIAVNSPGPCVGGSALLNAGPWASYLWSNGATTQTINVANAGTYSVTVTSTTNCTGVTSTSVNVGPPASPAIISSSGSFTICSGNSITLDPGAFASYIWSTGATTQTIVVSNAGTYSVTVTNANGCTGTTQRIVTSVVGANTNITAAGLLTYCAGTGNAVLTAAANASYLWSTGATTQAITITPNHPGNYCVTVTNTNGCSGSNCVLLSSDCVAPSPAPQPHINVTSTSAYVQWVQPGCVNGYNLLIRKVGTIPFTTYVIAPNSHYTFSGLSHNTCYEWKIQTRCDAAGTTVSAFTALDQFCTLARLSNEPDNAATEFKVYPNPAQDHVTLAFSSNDEGKFNVRLMDMTGRTILNEDHNAVMGDNQFEFNLTTIAKGAYILILQKGDQTQQAKIIVQ